MATPKDVLVESLKVARAMCDRAIAEKKRADEAEARVAELDKELASQGALLLLVRLSEAQLGSDYRCVARKLSEIAGALPFNPIRYAIIDGEVGLERSGEES